MWESGFLGMPDISAWLFIGLALTAFLTTYIGLVTGTAGGLMLLVVMASFFPPTILVPIHTMIMLGATTSRALMLWRYLLTGTVLPFVVGAVVGAVASAQIFTNIPGPVLQGILAVFIVLIVWLPEYGRIGSDKGRFALVGFAATFIGVFVSATGSIVSPFVAAASPDRRNYAATLATLMSCTHALKLTTFLFLGVAVGTYLPLVAVMIVMTLLGNYAGKLTLFRMEERSFRLIFKILMTLLALRLIWLAATQAGYI